MRSEDRRGVPGRRRLAVHPNHVHRVTVCSRMARPVSSAVTRAGRAACRTPPVFIIPARRHASPRRPAAVDLDLLTRDLGASRAATSSRSPDTRPASRAPSTPTRRRLVDGTAVRQLAVRGVRPPPRLGRLRPTGARASAARRRPSSPRSDVAPGAMTRSPLGRGRSQRRSAARGPPAAELNRRAPLKAGT